ncbi:MAG: LuxR C-terminal-related transcriptional regulator [Steroidobacteraceae bacterium]
MRQRFNSLSPREGRVNDMVVAGNANKVTAINLGLSERTVEIHRAKVMEKMGAHRCEGLGVAQSRDANYRCREWESL